MYYFMNHAQNRRNKLNQTHS